MTTATHSFTMHWWAGYEDDTGEYNEFAVEVEFSADVVITKDFDGEWQEVHADSVDIEEVNAVGVGDILDRMGARELSGLRERCAEFAQRGF